MQSFADTLSWCGLCDLGFSGPKFTRLYQQANGTQIRERLDSAVATCDWFNEFPQAKFFHRNSLTSDHSPLVLQIFSKKQRKKQGKLFHFEAMWLKENTCEEVVISAWQECLLLDFEFPTL